MKKFSLTSILIFAFKLFLEAQAIETQTRNRELLSGAGWQFLGAAEADKLPELGTPEFKQADWKEITTPHIFQTRSSYETPVRGWYRHKFTLDHSSQGKELYLVFEGAASIADVFVNGQHLGQHRGGYTRFIFDATKALHPGEENEIAILVDNDPNSTTDCLPVTSQGLYKVWGGLYRNVWLMETAPLHIDPTDDGASGVFLTPRKITNDSAELGIKVEIKNTTPREVKAEVHSSILDPESKVVEVFSGTTLVSGNQRSTLEITASIPHPQLWEPRKGKLYQVKTDLLVEGKLIDQVIEYTGFRTVNFDWKNNQVTVNGNRMLLSGANLHQETEEKGSAVSESDLQENLNTLYDMGANFVRLAHYPRASSEYDGCDKLGLLCWAENGNSTGRWDKIKNRASSTSVQITTEMVKQNYNHPSIVLWSVGNEASSEPAEQVVPIVKALDSSRPVVVANMTCTNADHVASNIYPGWYGGNMQGFRPQGFISEIGAGGLVTTHCDYDQADWRVDSYEPEEYQQLVAEHHFQKVFGGNAKQLGLFCWWNFREFSDHKYKKPVGINSKGLLTYAGDKKDVFYLYRCFLRPEEPTLWIASKRYFLRRGSANNGIKVYSSSPKVMLTLNGEKVSTLENGHYTIPDGPWNHHPEKKKPTSAPSGLTNSLVSTDASSAEASSITPEKAYEGARVDHVFYWPVSLRVGKNIVSVSDEQGHSDTATIYYYGNQGFSANPETGKSNLPISDLTSSNTNNPAYYIDDPVHPQWPIYYDLDSTADNSWNALPSELDNARWISLKRVTKHGMATDLSFATPKPMKIYLMSSKMDKIAVIPPDFKEIPSSTLWRDNNLQLVPAQLFLHETQAGEKISLHLGDRDAIVLLKEK